MRLIILSVIFLISCNSGESSFWETQKSSFRYQDKKEFVSENNLLAEYKTFKQIKHPLLDSIIGDSAYLYSWQNRDKTKNEFTVIKDEDELGLKIFYFILSKSDKLISWSQVAGKGAEAEYWFETSSKFINRDSMIKTESTTQWLDFEKLQPLQTTKGDTTYSYLIIDSTGEMTEKIFKEVKDLHFENE